MRLGSGDMKSPKITRPHLPTCGAPTGIELNGGIRTWGQSQTVTWMKQQARVQFISNKKVKEILHAFLKFFFIATFSSGPGRLYWQYTEWRIITFRF